MKIIWQTVRRITNEILGVKGLTPMSDQDKISANHITILTQYQADM